MKLVLISDTHELHQHLTVPPGDVLVHAGDFSWRGAIPAINSFMAWFSAQSHVHKICIAGNHDKLFESDNALARSLIPDNVIYLEDSEVVIDGVKFYGSPWTPRFHDWAFNVDRGPRIRNKWRLIPRDTDVLITHGPPHGVMDIVPGAGSVGCEELRRTIERRLKQLKLSVHGHIHEAYGQGKLGQATVINASIYNHSTHPPTLREPIIVEIDL